MGIRKALARLSLRRSCGVVVIKNATRSLPIRSLVSGNLALHIGSIQVRYFDITLEAHQTLEIPCAIECRRLSIVDWPLAPVEVKELSVGYLFQCNVSENLFQPLVRTPPKGKRYVSSPRTLFEVEIDGEAKPGICRHGLDRAVCADCASFDRKRVREKKEALDIFDLIKPILDPPLRIHDAKYLDLPSPLYSFQPEGIKFLLEHEGALLADEMGLGKTVMGVVAVRLLVQCGKVMRSLIVCPSGLLGVWQEHLERWAPSLFFIVVKGAPERREIEWRRDGHVFLVSYDTLRSDWEGERMQGVGSFDLVAVDEAQYIKNTDSSRSKAVRAFAGASYRWAITGTPMENSPEDLLSIFRFVAPEVADKLRSVVKEPEVLKKILAPYFLRRRKEDVWDEMPGKIRQEIWLDLDDKQRAAYDKAEREGKAGILEEQRKGCSEEKVRMHIFALIQKLKQICNFAPGNTKSPKTEVVRDLLEEAKQNSRKVIIFSQYVSEGVDKIVEATTEFNVKRLCGDMGSKERENSINEFRNQHEVCALACTLGTGGTGLTLTEASCVIHFDHWWNPAKMWQAEDRIHRYGQKAKAVNIYSLWMNDTIDERIKDILERKGIMFEEVVEGLREEVIEKKITIDDLLEIVGIKKEGAGVRQPPESGAGNEDRAALLKRIQDMAPDEFEKFACLLFQRLGYENARVTGRSGDGGIDIRGTKSMPGGTDILVVQCKRKESVGVAAARELLGVKISVRATTAYLVTSGSFTDACREFAQENSIMLLDGVQIVDHALLSGLRI